MTDTPHGISLKETARLLLISRSTLQRMVRRGDIKTVKVSPRRRIVPSTEIQRILTS